jgi:hypothetical protein
MLVRKNTGLAVLQVVTYEGTLPVFVATFSGLLVERTYVDLLLVFLVRARVQYFRSGADKAGYPCLATSALHEVVLPRRVP